MLCQKIQLPDGWCRQDGPASVLLQSGSCWQEVVEIHLLRPVEHWHNQRLHPLEEDEPPLPANSRVSSLKTWKMRLIHNMVDNYVSRRQHRCDSAVDNLSVERVFADNIVPGHPLVRFSGRKRTCKQCASQKRKTAKGRRYIVSCFGCAVCKLYLCRTGCFVAFHRDMH